MTKAIDFIQEVSAIFQTSRLQINYIHLVLKQSPWRPE